MGKSRKNNRAYLTLLVVLMLSFVFMIAVRNTNPVLLSDIGDFFTIFSFVALLILILFGRRIEA